MDFSRIPHPSNFTFAEHADPATGHVTLSSHHPRLEVTDLGGDVHRLRLRDGPWEPHGSHAELTASIDGPTEHRVALEPNGRLRVESVRPTAEPPLLLGAAAGTMGICGCAWLLQWEHTPDLQFYGLGEHAGPLEKSGLRAKFWNADLFGDFPVNEIYHGYPNPMYVAIPWVIIKRGDRYVGLLVNNPDAVFMEFASNFIWNEQNPDDRARRSFYVGAPRGEPEVYVIVGPDLPALVRKFQTLVGRTPLPPLWALGHHQCRWGYASPSDLQRLDAAFRDAEIPCDGLWLDIDYMEAYKVFTFSSTHWRDEAQVQRVLRQLSRRGRRVVPILDPGVKVEAGYAVAEDGQREGVFCLNPEGRPYIGFVWPGQTYFPDFSLPEGRQWWAQRVEAFAALGFGGAWIDMNDPSVGAVELDDMRFDHGRRAHASYHNQYALGMARATRDGLLAAAPEQRPFLLSRSAFISSSRSTAVWLGDNVSNWHHLRLAIPLSLGLALSGLPFNGPDVGGFMLDTTPELTVAWYKTGFLFPFLRNHSSRGTKAQEPWALGPRARPVIAHYIRLRYKLLPYLYQLFVQQEATGAAIQRPLFHDFADTADLPLGRIEDQFMIGPALLQAPVVREGETSRELVLPGAGGWYDARRGGWLEGGQTRRVEVGRAETPLFVREGSLVPMQVGERRHQRNDLATIELHCFLRRTTTGPAHLEYVCDDGETFAYQRGERTVVQIEASVVDRQQLDIELRVVCARYRRLRLSVVVYDQFRDVRVVVGGRRRVLPLRASRWRFTGRPLRVQQTAAFTVGAARSR